MSSALSGRLVRGWYGPISRSFTRRHNPSYLPAATTVLSILTPRRCSITFYGPSSGAAPSGVIHHPRPQAFLIQSTVGVVSIAVGQPWYLCFESCFSGGRCLGGIEA